MSAEAIIRLAIRAGAIEVVARIVRELIGELAQLTKETETDIDDRIVERLRCILHECDN